MKSFEVIFENDRLICECEAEPTPDGGTVFLNILVTDKLTGVSREEDELPEGLFAVATAVANAKIEGE